IDSQLCVLIDYRKDNNNEYHELVCNQKGIFWKGMKMKLYIEENANGKKTRNRIKYYEEFAIQFWLKP
ncbi:15859_t:CDS:2, partial [Cetraspora pellucida]